MQILSYSERGIIKSLFYEISYSHNSLQLLNRFLGLIYFPYKTINFRISEAKILIEQSFSDFGDPDALLLLTNNGIKLAAFIEAKVKTSQRLSWLISQEFEEFTKGINVNDMNSSNLFTQLYYKVRLVKALQKGGTDLLKKGVHFPEWSSRKYRRIGNNKVVLKAVDLLSNYCEDAVFIAIVPDNISSIKDFYQNTLKNYNPIGLQEWDITNWGCISWGEVERFCTVNNLQRVMENFRFNEGQIYNKNEDDQT